MQESYSKFWSNYVNFSGVSSRPDYWWPVLINNIIIILLSIPLSNNSSSLSDLFGIILFLFLIGAFLPGLAVTVRRLRDAGYHWAFIFLNFIPLIGSIAVIILLCMPTSDSDNNIFTSNKPADTPAELEKWYKLKKEGVITNEEYETKKKDLL